VVPEVGVQLSVRITDWVYATVGYSFLYLSDVARPGDQVDRNVNVQPVPAGVPALIPPAAPPPTFRSTNFWAQGLDIGLRFSF